MKTTGAMTAARAAAKAQGHRLGRWRWLGFSTIRYAQCPVCRATVDLEADGRVTGKALSARCTGRESGTDNRIPPFGRPTLTAKETAAA